MKNEKRKIFKMFRVIWLRRHCLPVIVVFSFNFYLLAFFYRKAPLAHKLLKLHKPHKLHQKTNTQKKTLTTFLLLLILSTACFAQEEQNEEFRKGFSGGITLLGPGQFISFDLSYFVTRNLNIEAGLGLPMSYGGIKFYFGPSSLPPKKPYLGLQVTYGRLLTDIACAGANMDAGWGLYAPIGFSLVGGRTFSLSFELALWHHFVEPKTIGWLGLKFKFHSF